MRHETLARVAEAARADAFESFAPATVAERTETAVAAMPAPAVPDVAPGVGGLIVGAYAALIATFFAFFTGSLLATMVVTISAGFVAIFFAVPRIFLGLEGDASRRPDLAEFWHEGLDTLTGHSSGRDALVQMLIVPVLLTFGIFAMGIAAAFYL